MSGTKVGCYRIVTCIDIDAESPDRAYAKLRHFMEHIPDGFDWESSDEWYDDSGDPIDASIIPDIRMASFSEAEKKAMNENFGDAVECTTCGKETMNSDTRRCNFCWAVESRLDTYLSFPSGRQLLENSMKSLSLKSSAAVATELFDEDELERYSDELNKAKEAVLDGHVEDVRGWIIHGEDDALRGFLRQWLKLDSMTLSEIVDQHGCYLPDEEE